jgi:hypothetical protein
MPLLPAPLWKTKILLLLLLLPLLLLLLLQPRPRAWNSRCLVLLTALSQQPVL